MNELFVVDAFFYSTIMVSISSFFDIDFTSGFIDTLGQGALFTIRWDVGFSKAFRIPHKRWVVCGLIEVFNVFGVRFYLFTV